MKEPHGFKACICNDGKVSALYLKSEVDRYINWLKYKRCMAMAKWCACAIRYTGRLGYKKYGHYVRWYNKWIELADKCRKKAEEYK